MSVRLVLGENQIPLEPAAGKESSNGQSLSTVYWAEDLTSIEWQEHDGVAAIEIAYEGEVPRLGEVFWSTEEEGEPVSWRLRVPLEKGLGPYERALLDQDLRHRDVVSQSVPHGDVQAVAEEERSLEQLFRLRSEAIEDRARIERFFYALDRGSRTGPPAWLGTIFSVTTLLWSRIESRQHLALGEKPCVPVFVPILQQATYRRKKHDHLVQVSAFLRQLVNGHLEGIRDYDLVDWAFEQFVTDEAVCSHPERSAHEQLGAQGAPDSTQYLKFAELAFACIENKVDEAFWRRHLSTLVRTSHIVLEHSVTRARSKPFPASVADFEFGRGRRYPDSRRFQLRGEYEQEFGLAEGASVERLAGRFGSLLALAFHPFLMTASAAMTLPLQNAARLVPWGILVDGEHGVLISRGGLGPNSPSPPGQPGSTPSSVG